MSRPTQFISTTQRENAEYLVYHLFHGAYITGKENKLLDSFLFHFSMLRQETKMEICDLADIIGSIMKIFLNDPALADRLPKWERKNLGSALCGVQKLLIDIHSNDALLNAVEVLKYDDLNEESDDKIDYMLMLAEKTYNENRDMGLSKPSYLNDPVKLAAEIDKIWEISEAEAKEYIQKQNVTLSPADPATKYFQGPTVLMKTKAEVAA